MARETASSPVLDPGAALLEAPAIDMIFEQSAKLKFARDEYRKVLELSKFEYYDRLDVSVSYRIGGVTIPVRAERDAEVLGSIIADGLTIRLYEIAEANSQLLELTSSLDKFFSKCRRDEAEAVIENALAAEDRADSPPPFGYGLGVP